MSGLRAPPGPDTPFPEDGPDGIPGDASGEIPAGLVVAQGDAAVGRHLRGWPTASGAYDLAAGGAAGLDVVFGAAGNAAPVTRAGWSVPEPGYTWTVGPRARLVLPRPAESGAHELQIQLAPFVHPGRLAFQRLGLTVNGARLATWRIAEQVVIAAAVPAALLAARDAVELVFDLPDAARPVAISGFNDGRALAFSFRRLMLTPVMSAPAPVPAAPPLSERSPPAPSPVAPAGPGRGGGPGLSREALMLRFESLGENCEFGLAQRRCGAEPLGLLRFASAPLPKLLAALRARFAGMGAADNIVVELSSNGREYMVHDRAFGFTYHAWVKLGEQTPAEIHAREARRVPFLVRKLIADLAEGEKIFVFHGMEPLRLSDARNLAAAIRRHGPGTLFWVEVADAAHPPDTVEWVEEGLLKGYIARFAPGEDANDFLLGGWVALCGQAIRVLKS
jgi:hypothetical protein